MPKAAAKKSEKLSAPERQMLARILRVDQAGEYGAKRIYQGQLDVLKKHGASPKEIKKIEHMAAQEDMHLAAFNNEIAGMQSRPSVLQPLWHVAGYAVGAASALLGAKAAHACTVAVETVIDQHYAAQEETLKAYPRLQKMIAKFRAEENEHKEMALASGAEETVGYPVLKRAIAAGSKLSIWLAERF
jgi:ubiquinone biosynthesis monooxygenase Coq7